jgi:CRP/FNR family cyclic AMP-dependent transcriptional regulator
MQQAIQISQQHYEFVAQIDRGQTAVYEKDVDIFVQGAPADAVFFIQSGQIKMTATCDVGREAIVAILEAGHFLGESCIGEQTHRHTTATALTMCRITPIRKAAMNEALDSQPAFAKFFMRHLLPETAGSRGT